MSPSPNFALTSDSAGCYVNGVATLRCIPCLMQNIVNFGLIMAAIVAAFFILFSGWKFATSGGDPVRIASAKKVMIYAGAGLVIVLLSYSILNFAGSSFGINFFQQCEK